jgi:hypothetical protein
MSKWEHLLESDDRLQRAERAYRASGAADDFVNLLKAQLRANKLRHIDLRSVEHIDDVAKTFDLEDYTWMRQTLAGSVKRIERLMKVRIRPTTTQAKVETSIIKLVYHQHDGSNRTGSTGVAAFLKVILPTKRNRENSYSDASTVEKSAYEGGGNVFSVRVQWDTPVKFAMGDQPDTIDYKDDDNYTNLSWINDEVKWYLVNIRGTILYSRIRAYPKGAIGRY